MFHTDKDPLPFMADIAERNNSGADVPIAKIVNPMNSGDNLNILATLTLELINLSAENHNKNNHNKSTMIARTIIIFIKNKRLILVFFAKNTSKRKRLN